LTSRSRALLAAIFFRQNAALPRGLMKCLGHPCQKHPSTNTASFNLGNTKSGFTWNFCKTSWSLAFRAWDFVPVDFG